MKNAEHILLSKLDEAKSSLKQRCSNFPKFVIVLGSGLAGLLDSMEVETEIPYSQIPNMKGVSVQGHVGKLVIGSLGGVRVACMQGRIHYYEGHAMEDVVFPYRAFALAGAEVFFLTNAAGGLKPTMKPADLLLIEDHINLTGTNPLIGKNIEELGVRFPDMTNVYDPKLRAIVEKKAKSLKIPLKKGVYLGLHGPSYETPAEIRFYKKMGVDVVGMSTVPEAIALNHMKKRVVAVSCITNLAAGVTKKALVHDEVLESAKKVQKAFSKLVIESIKEMNKVYAKE